MRSRLALAAGTAAGIATVVVVLALLPGPEDRTPAAPGLAAAPIPARQVTDLERAVRLAGAQRVTHDYDFGIGVHDDGAVTYPTNPPTNGPHANRWALDGNYAGAPAPSTGEVVHAQEHGRVVIQYRPGLPEHQLRQLVALYEESPHHVLLVENATGMNCDVAATAWGQSVLCPKLNDRSFDALRAFRDAFRDRGPERVP